MGFRLSKFGYLKQKTTRKISRKLGVLAKSKWLRQLKRGVKHLRVGSASVSSSQPVSASTVYQHQPRTLSQMTGGV